MHGRRQWTACVSDSHERGCARKCEKKRGAGTKDENVNTRTKAMKSVSMDSPVGLLRPLIGGGCKHLGRLESESLCITVLPAFRIRWARPVSRRHRRTLQVSRPPHQTVLSIAFAGLQELARGGVDAGPLRAHCAGLGRLIIDPPDGGGCGRRPTCAGRPASQRHAM